MTATLDPLAADEVYASLLEPHPVARWRRVVGAALDLWCATSGGLLELSSSGDIVVRRRSDGVEELRIWAGPPQSAAHLLQSVSVDLASLSPEEFRTAWGIA
jgi:hypothetical protein